MIRIKRRVAMLVAMVASASFSYVALADNAHRSHTLNETGDLAPQAAAFHAENDAAMGKMMADMDVSSTGDIDRDFVAMMVAHHQGAIDMAVTMLKYGRNEQLKRLAQEIIIEQRQEIAVMKMAVGEPPSGADHTNINP